MPVRAILVSGLPGAGKSLLVEAARELGIPTVSMGDVVREEARRRGLPETSEVLARLARELRDLRGPQAVAELTVRKAEAVAESSDTVLIDGVRSWEEVEFFERAFGDVVIVAVHAPRRVRFERLVARGREDDPKTWEEFVERDERELGLGVGKVIALSDAMLLNYGKSKEEALREAKELLAEVVCGGGRG
ncbi:MAG: dephospho-CoA kinase [Thermoprotei archaeon]|nr:MAG: dephospho-CoA kinase [Thermoprotei archaeon]